MGLTKKNRKLKHVQREIEQFEDIRYATINSNYYASFNNNHMKGEDLAEIDNELERLRAEECALIKKIQDKHLTNHTDKIRENTIKKS